MTINPKTKNAYELFHNGALALSRAEMQGIRVDVNYLETKKAHLTKKIERLENQFYSSSFYRHWQHASKSTVNIYSPVQLSHFLFTIKKLKTDKTTVTGKFSTDEDALRELNIPELDILIQIKKIKKIKDTYLESFYREQVNGYIHPFFNLHLVRTFRSSSDHPNFQNIPKRDEEANKICRKALYPRPGHQLMEIDFSGMEVRIAACYHKDPVMLKYLYDPTTDMHGDMAKQIFLIDCFDKSIPVHYTFRQAAKNGFVFPEFYGDYYKNCAISLACEWGKLPNGKWKPGQGLDMVGWEPKFNDFHLSDHLISKGIKSIDAFTEHIKQVENDFWGNRFKVYAQWKENWYNTYKKNGYIDMKTGFRCRGIMSKNDVINYPVQGAAFHCLLWCFIALDDIIIRENLKTRLINQIHDSIWLDVHPDELEYIKKITKQVTCYDLSENWKWINVPLEVDAELCPVDGNWTQKEKIKL